MRIDVISTSDLGGGAESVAWRLFGRYRDRGHDARMLVGVKRGDDPAVAAIPNAKAYTAWSRACWAAAGRLVPLVGRIKGADVLRMALQGPLARPRTWWDVRRGREDFDFPGTRRLLDPSGSRPDVVHGHNLHGAWLPTGGYFDLRALPELSQRVPTVLTLHDAWLLSGHCAHSFDCERWLIGCGHCPDLTIYPAVRRDATAFNWRRKQTLAAASRLRIATPSAWLMRKVERSLLAPGIVEARVIPNGVDRAVFAPGDKAAARLRLGLPTEARLLLFTANVVTANPWKDYTTLRAAVVRAAELCPDERIVFLALGESREPERVGHAEIRFVGHESDQTRVADYYRASDVYLHAARADTFPNTVIEALACGVPVIATAVGGIPEQVDSLDRVEPSSATGVLVPPADPAAMAEAITRLLGDEPLRERLAANAAAAAADRFDLHQQADDYLAWFEEIVATPRSR